MMGNGILYLVKGNRETLIEYKEKREVVPSIIKKVIDEYCVQEFKTYDGCVNSARKILKIKNKTPIVINESLILQPLYSNRNWEQIYVNMVELKSIIDDGNGCTLVFFGDKKLKCNLSYQEMNTRRQTIREIRSYLIKL